MSLDITTVPFCARAGVRRSDRAGALLMLPGEESFTNHLGTVHAGALLTLAESASGERLIREFGAAGLDVVPVVRRVEAKFRKPARGAVHASAEIGAEAREEFVTALAARGRAAVDVAVEVHDESGVLALTATVEWFVAKRA